MQFIGIDLGTSACKFLLMDEKGQILNVVSEGYDVAYPQPGWSEQNPRDWWQAVLRGVPALLADFDASQVAGIGVAGQMHGLVALDADDDVIRPAILWNDGRTVKQVEYLNQAVGQSRLLEWTGNIAYAGFTAPKILWMRENEPENYADIAHVMLPKDYVNHLLCGAYATDVSDASGTLLFDEGARDWSEPMLEICGLTRAEVPQVFESYEKIGTILPQVADELGLPHDVVICAGAGDNAAAAIGTGCVGAGSMNVSLGTSGTVFIPTLSYAVGVGDRIHSFCHADGSWHLMGCILSAASCNAWWVQNILGSKDFAAAQDGISADDAPLSLPYFLPYLMGERTPHNDTLARGAFVGMSMSTTCADLTRAVLEGVAFAIRDSVEIARALGVDVEASTVCGGGAKSRLWLQILANVLDIELKLPVTEQGPGYGGAIAAAVAAGAYPSVREACEKIVAIRDTVVPNPAAIDAYEARYQAWREMYPALKPSFAKIGA